MSDGQGGSTITPTTVASGVCAAVEALTGREQVSAGAIASTATWRIRMRGRTDITVTPELQVAWTSNGVTRAFQIVAVLPADTSNREMHLFCVEEQS